MARSMLFESVDVDVAAAIRVGEVETGSRGSEEARKKQGDKNITTTTATTTG